MINNDTLMKGKVECPFCNGAASIKSQPKEITYKHELHTVESYYYQCDKCHEEFTTTETDTKTLLQVYK